MIKMTHFFRRRPWLQGVALAAIMPSLTIYSPQVQANPSGGIVTHGIAEINGDIEGHLKIFQESNRAVINWEDFSIGEGEITEFIQAADASALSRVMSGNPSSIFGTLKASGSHILVNPNGILVGAGGVVDVAGMNILSTLNITDDNFLAGGDLVFTGSNPTGVTNFGTITGKDVILLGNFVDNSGTIGAPDGVVALGAGGNIVVGQTGDSKISVTGAGPGGATGINNSGDITGSSVEMKAHGNVYALAINNSGMVRAQGFNFEGGRLTLDAGVDGGNIVNTGQLVANTADGSGGTISINAGAIGEVDLAGGSVQADGVAGADGGVIDIQGAMINVADGVRVSANGENGGSINVGNNSATEAVAIGAGASVTANGASGAGGFVNVTGTSTSIIDVLGTISADGATSGGTVAMTGGTINSAAGSVISANGTEDGGTIAIAGDSTNGGVNIAGLVSANSANGDGGSISVGAADVQVSETGMIQADGVNGGQISVFGEDVTVDGNVSAVGSDGDGGLIRVEGDNSVSVGATGVLNASGSENGGRIMVDSPNETNFAGTALATGTNGDGGRVDITGDTVNIAGTANVDANGATAGGQINVGGGFQGDDSSLRNATSTNVAEGARFSANSSGGNAGQVVVWADNDTTFRGDISAQATGEVGNGGMIEVSGAQVLDFGGAISASSVGGLAGTALFDPGNLLIDQTQITTINNTLQGGTNVLLLTEDGTITFADLGGGSANGNNALNNNRHASIQWTNSAASFGAFAGDSIFIFNNIRTSGGGSINLIAGWTGLESDDPLTTFATPENAWENYVESGDFGNGGSVIIGDVGGTRHYEVGSRFGNTNVAAANVIITAPDTNDESRYAILGFQDSGSVFAPRFNNIDNTRDLDLNNQFLEVDNDVLVGIVRENEVDRNGDGIVDGVFAINSLGVLDGSFDANGDGFTNSDDETFIPYASAFDDSRYGNWWWQQISDDPAVAADALGDLLPESGAGGRNTDVADIDFGTIDDTQRADINVVTTGAVIINGGGRTEGSAMIGHGGNSAGWADDRSLRNSGIEQSQATRYWSYNGAGSDRSAIAIARNNPVYGNINILAGVDPTSVLYDRDAADVNLTGTVTSQAGLVQLVGFDRTSGANDPTNPNAGGIDRAFVQIGHGGAGQFGSFYGNINIDAGGDITVDAGGGSSSHASIGHTVDSVAYWNPTDGASQIRFFANSADFDNPNLRRGELFSDGVGGLGRGAYEFGAQGGTFDDDFYGDGTPAGATAARDGAVQVAALDGFVEKTMSGDINVRSAGPNGITVTAYSTEDIRTGTDENGAGGTGGVTITRERRFASIGHGGSSNDVWQEDGTERVRLRIANGGELESESVSINGTDNGTRIGRNQTFMNLFGDINVEATNGNVEVYGGNNRLDFAMIGHGGADLADYETSNAAIGDISVTAGNDIIVEGGGRVANTANDANDNGSSTIRAYAMIGHGGWESGLQYLTGDIAINAGGDLRVTGGAYQYAFGQIGHGGGNNYSQVGGDFTRDESFEMNASAGNGIFNSDFDFDGTTATVTSGLNVSTFTLSGNTANITVTVEGDIVMDHLGNGERFTPNVIDNDGDKDNGQETDWAYSLIGHGGRNVDALQQGNTEYNFDDKVGDITVNVGTSSIATDGSTVISGGDITMTNGAGDTHYTAIGHRGGDAGDRVGGDNAMILGGDITVNALGSIVMDASVAGQYFQNDLYVPLNANALTPETTVAPATDAILDAAALSGGNYTLMTIGTGIDSGSISITASLGGNAVAITDDGAGGLTDGTNTVGSIDYTTGEIMFDEIVDDAGAVSVNYAHSGGTAVAGETDGVLDAAALTAGMFDATIPNAGQTIQIGSVEVNGDLGGTPVVLTDTAVAGVLNDGTNDVGTIDYTTGAIQFSTAFADMANVTVEFVTEGSANPAIGTDDNAEAVLAVDRGRVNEGSPVVIGHGGALNNLDIQVRGDGAVISGITTDSNITVNAGEDITLTAGVGLRGMHAQIGHGFASDRGNDNANADGFDGFDGDITVSAGNDMTLNGGDAGALLGRRDVDSIYSTHGNAAFIGNGGHLLDGVILGDISVYVGNDLALNGGNRTAATGAGLDPDGNAASTYFNVAKIGHHSSEMDRINTVRNLDIRPDGLNDGRAQTGGGTVPNATNQAGYFNLDAQEGVVADAIGDISVVVGNDLTLTGGTTDDVTNAPVLFNYAQIGNGGAGMAGDKTGDITIQVGNDVTTVDGTEDADVTTANNYVQIGHGDWLRDGEVGVVNGTSGERSGDITLAAGNNITLDHTLIGHADPDVLVGLTTIDSASNTYVGVSRNDPFIGGTGTLTTTNGTVMTSGFYGFGGELRIYAPSRTQNAMDTTTRLNEATATYIGTPIAFGPATPGDGSVFDDSLGADAGREDEIYLQPDLFYDNTDRASDAGILGGEAFPTDATSGQGGAVATVSDPGGFPNLVSLNAAGTLGSGTADYNGSNGVSGVGNYTIYYDVIDGTPPAVAGGGGFAGGGGGSGAPVVAPPIIFIPPTPEIEEPIPVVVPGFNFFPFLFVDKFDSYDRNQRLVDPLEGGSAFGLARLFRALLEEDTEEEILVAEGFLDEDDIEDPADDEEEDEEVIVNGQTGRTGGIFYVYDSSAGEYSSFREFGVPATETGL